MALEKQVVLVVDDEPGILRLLKLELKTQDFQVFTAGSAEEARKILSEQTVDLILLDILMPGESGLEFLKSLRLTSRVPVIIISAKEGTNTKVYALDCGADDYVTKPFSLSELVARIRVVLRRTSATEEYIPLIIGNLKIHLQERYVSKDGDIVTLTRTELVLLAKLAERPNQIIPDSELLSIVWGPEYREDLQYLRLWTTRLRQKLEVDPQNPRVIVKVELKQGSGYMLVVPVPEVLST